MNNFITKIIDHDDLKPEDIDSLRKWISKCKIGVCLRKMTNVALNILDGELNHPRALSFIVEFVAGLKYAFDDASVGRMRELKNQFNCCTSKEAIIFLKRFCRKLWNDRAWKEQNMWFRLRVYCMDAYALSHIFNTTKETVVYYAGASHTKNVVHYLLEHKLATVVESSSNSVWTRVRRLCSENGIMHCLILQLAHTQLIIAGENHNITETSFGTEIISMMTELCHTTPILFMIEKHISNKRDMLQRNLMCNQPSLALHQSRCSAFVESEHEKCQQVQVVAVDNRHTDMGFLRTELMDLWNDDPEFRASSEEFQRSSLLSMHSFCKTLLLCNEMRTWEAS